MKLKLFVLGMIAVAGAALAAQEKTVMVGGESMFPSKNIVANVNMDMPVLMFPIDTVVAFGSEHSTLGDVATRAATMAGLKLIPDPMPEQTLFVRSDQYSFVRTGVPAVFLVSGFTSSDPKIDGSALFREFITKHYHQPSDQIDLPIDDGAVERFTRANVTMGYLIATSTEAPSWRADSFFGKTFGASR